MEQKTFTVLNLGAGVQSSAIYLRMIAGELPPCDVAIFADCGDEPWMVYETVEWLKKQGGPEIITVSRGNLADNLVRGIASDGGRFASIPAFVSANDDGQNDGIQKRLCTVEYKVVPVEAEIRRLLEVQKGRPVPKSITVRQIFGLSYDEPGRVGRVRTRFAAMPSNWQCSMPLYDDFWERSHCSSWLNEHYPNIKFWRSACAFCPYREDVEWVALQQEDPAAFEKACQVDESLRDSKSACTRGMNGTMYLHRSCKPLRTVTFNQEAKPKNARLDFAVECSGFCGN